MTPIWSNGQGPRTFDTLPKVQVVKKYVIMINLAQEICNIAGIDSNTKVW